MQSELETAKRDAEQANAQAEEFAGLFASLNAELEKANAQRASETGASGNLKAYDGGQHSFRPNELSLPAAYVVRDAAGNCAVVDFQPSADSDLKIIESSDYAECKDVIDRKDIGEVEQGVEAKFEAARVKAGSQ